MEKEKLSNNTNIMRCYSGSLAYGTNLPTSDVDIRGLFCAPPECIRTPFFPVKEKVLEEEEDGKLYEVTNFFKLFMDMNPNIIELAFTDKSDIIETSEAYEYLRAEAPGLLSKKVAFTFSGYAMAQLKRIKGHDKWLNNPQPKEIPVQRDFMKLTHSWLEQNVVTQDSLRVTLEKLDPICVFLPMGDNTYGIISSSTNAGLFNDDGSIRKVPYSQFSEGDKKQPPMLIVKYLAEEHRLDKEKHKNYWTWKKNRNIARHQLEVDFGYDTKHAMHLVRLMRMAEEILSTGQVLVKRPDAKELLDIRGGAWKLEDLLKWAEEKDSHIRGELYQNSRALPRKADLHKAAKVLMDIQEMCWRKTP